MKIKKNINNQAFSLVEIIVSIALFVLISSALVSLSLSGLQGLQRGDDRLEAEALATEGLEAVLSIRDRSWNELIYTTTSLKNINGYWEFNGENVSEQIGKFTRTLYFSDLCRDSNNSIVDCDSGEVDVFSKKLRVEVKWLTQNNNQAVINKYSLLTDWNSNFWRQTDWSGGDGQEIWSDQSKFLEENNIDYSQAGEIKIKQTIIDHWSRDGGSPFVDDTDDDFNEGKFDKTELVNTGTSAKVKLTSIIQWVEDKFSSELGSVKYYDLDYVDNNNIWACGTSGEIIFNDGTGWNVFQDTGGQIWRSIDMIDNSNGWVVGNSGKIYKYNGVNWSQEIDTGSEYWYGLSMVSSNFGWAVGRDGVNAYYDGSWHEEAQLAKGDYDLNDVFMLDDSHGWIAASHGKIFSYNNGSWLSVGANEIVDTTDNDFNEGKFDFMTVTSTGENASLILTTTTMWLADEYDRVSSDDFYAVYQINANDIWAVGESGKFYHYDGSEWSLFQQVNSNNIYCLFMINSTDGWAAGDSGKIYHFNGSNWSQFQDTGSQTWTGLYMLSSTDGWLAGNRGKIYHFNGSNWSQFQDTGSQTWNSIQMLSPTDGWVVGNSGKIYHFNGSNWSQFQDTGSQTWYDIQMLSPTDGWVVGNSGKIYHFNGSNWSQFKDTGSQTWYDIYMLSPTSGWISGNSGNIYIYNGNNWTREIDTGGQRWRAITMIDEQNGFVFGHNGRLYKYQVVYVEKGMFGSRILDSEQLDTNWQNISWVEDLPSGAMITVRVRTGNTPIPDGSWSGWSSELSNGSSINNTGRYIQYQLFVVNGDDLTLTPKIDQVIITYGKPLATEDLHAVHANRSDNVWVVGDKGVVIHYDGVEWQLVNTGYNYYYSDVYIIDDNDIWLSSLDGFAVHFDGTNWDRYKKFDGFELYTIEFLNSTNGWTLGKSSRIFHYTNSYVDEGYFYSRIFDSGSTTSTWDAISWVEDLPNDTKITISTRTGNTPIPDLSWSDWGDELANGDDIDAPDGRYFQYRATLSSSSDNLSTPQLDKVEIMYNLITGQNLNGLDFVDENNVWVVGRNGTIIYYDGNEWNLIENKPVTNELHDVFVYDSTHIWAVGASGKILFYDGVKWDEQADVGSVTLYGVHGVAINNIWTVGASGKIYHYDGSSWTEFKDVGSTTLYSIRLSSANNGWIVGTSGKIYHYDGSDWTQFKDVGSATLFGLYMLNVNNGWIVGTSGKIYHYDGSDWTQFKDTGGETWREVYMINDDEGWAVGNYGRIMHYYDNDWHEDINSPTGSILNDVVFIDQDNGWAVGRNGTILKFERIYDYPGLGYLISSAFNNTRPLKIVGWDEDLSFCDPGACQVLVQIKTASNEGGQPGEWSQTWCGPEGEDGDETDYFTLKDGEMVNLDHNNDQWVKYKIILQSSGHYSPVVSEIWLNY